MPALPHQTAPHFVPSCRSALGLMRRLVLPCICLLSSSGTRRVIPCETVAACRQCWEEAEADPQPALQPRSAQLHRALKTMRTQLNGITQNGTDGRKKATGVEERNKRMNAGRCTVSLSTALAPALQPATPYPCIDVSCRLGLALTALGHPQRQPPAAGGRSGR